MGNEPWEHMKAKLPRQTKWQVRRASARTPVWLECREPLGKGDVDEAGKMVRARPHPLACWPLLAVKILI